MQSEFFKCLRYLFKPRRFLILFKYIRQNRRLKRIHSYVALGAILNETELGEHVWIGENCELTKSIIGRHTYCGGNTHIFNTSIGSFCSIAGNSVIGVGKHPTTMVSTHPAFYAVNKPFTTYADQNYINEYGKIEIGNDVWIGTRVIILPDIHIGNGAIIASGAVVTKDVAPYSIVGGVPAKHIKYRLDKDIADRVERSQWWKCDEEYLRNHFLDFHNPITFSI